MKSTQLALVTIFLLSTSLPAFAQSGSSNGNGNRDVLDYQSDLRASDLSIQSFDEALRKLHDQLEALSKERTPTFNGPEAQFWNQLTDTGRKAVLAFDEDLIKSIQRPIDLTNSARAAIRAALATVEATTRDQQQYADRGFAADLAKTIKKARAEIMLDGQARMAQIVDSMLEVLGLDVYEDYMHHFYEGKKLEQFFSACDTAPCIDLINQRAVQYMDFVKVGFDTDIKILSKSKRLSEWHDSYRKENHYHNSYPSDQRYGHYCNEKASKLLSITFNVIAESRFRVTYSKNQQAIKAANNQNP